MYFWGRKKISTSYWTVGHKSPPLVPRRDSSGEEEAAGAECRFELADPGAEGSLVAVPVRLTVSLNKYKLYCTVLYCTVLPFLCTGQSYSQSSKKNIYFTVWYCTVQYGTLLYSFVAAPVSMRSI